MYKILIKYASKAKDLWEVYGTSTISTTGTVTFTEFETDDVEALKEEILTLDQEYGYENIRVIKDVSYVLNVDITDTENE